MKNEKDRSVEFCCVRLQFVRVDAFAFKLLASSSSTIDHRPSSSSSKEYVSGGNTCKKVSNIIEVLHRREFLRLHNSFVETEPPDCPPHSPFTLLSWNKEEQQRSERRKNFGWDKVLVW